MVLRVLAKLKHFNLDDSDWIIDYRSSAHKTLPVHKAKEVDMKCHHQLLPPSYTQVCMAHNID